MQTGREKAVYQEWESWAFGPLLHVTYVCLQGLLGPIMYMISIQCWGAAMHAQLYGLMGQITPSS